MSKKPLLAIAFAFTALSVSPVVAQSTWTVGPGADFESLSDAVNRVAAGDVLVLAPGTHSSPLIRRGITLLAGGASLDRLEIRDLPPNESVLIVGLEVEDEIVLHANHGATHLQYCSVHGHEALESPVRIESCALVTITDCSFEFASHLLSMSKVATVWVTESLVSLVDSTATGFGSHVLYGPTPAIHAAFSELHLTNPILRGGDAVLSWGADPSPALSLSACDCTIAGDHRAQCVRGDSFGYPTEARDLLTSGGSLDINAACAIASSSIRSFRTVVRYPKIASMLATAVPPGGSMPVELIASPGDLVGAFLGLPMWPATIPSIGMLWLDAATAIPLGSALLEGSSWTFEVRVPFGVAEGTVLTLQGVVLQNDGDMVLTKPVSVVLPGRR